MLVFYKDSARPKRKGSKHGVALSLWVHPQRLMRDRRELPHPSPTARVRHFSEHYQIRVVRASSGDGCDEDKPNRHQTFQNRSRRAKRNLAKLNYLELNHSAWLAAQTLLKEALASVSFQHHLLVVLA